jgi:hypothetical protein
LFSQCDCDQLINEQKEWQASTIHFLLKEGTIHFLLKEGIAGRRDWHDSEIETSSTGTSVARHQRKRKRGTWLMELYDYL